MIRILLCLATLTLFQACSSALEAEAEYPVDPDERRLARQGKLTGEDGLVLFGGEDDDESGGGHSGIGINSYLWRATLDTISFMPLASADPFGGVILTDWYEDPQSKGERFKLNVVITDRRLTSTAVKVSAFKQELKGNTWRDSMISASIADDLENKILTRARQLRARE